MKLFVSLIVVQSLYFSTANEEKINKCGLLDFNPRLVSLQTLSWDYYLYTDVPVPPCENGVMNYVNYCYNYPQPGTGIVQVGGVYLLRRTGTHEHEIVDYLSLRTDTRSCQGRVFMNGGRTLCCISQLSTFSQRSVISSRNRSHSFALYVPMTSYSISLGYSDAQYTTSGYNPDFITTSIGSRVGRSTETSTLPMPLVSFSETDSWSVTNSTIETDNVTTSTQETTSPISPHIAPADPTSSTHSNPITSEHDTPSPSHPSPPFCCTSRMSPCAISIIVLTILLAIFIIISIFLGILLFKRRNRRSGMNCMKESHYINCRNDEIKCSSILPTSAESYNFLSHRPLKSTGHGTQSLVGGYTGKYKPEQCSTCTTNADKCNVYDVIPETLERERQAPGHVLPRHQENSSLHAGTHSKSLASEHSKSASMKNNPMYGIRPVFLSSDNS